MKDVCQQRITAIGYTVRFALNGRFDYPSTACPPYGTSESGRSAQVRIHPKLRALVLNRKAVT